MKMSYFYFVCLDLVAGGTIVYPTVTFPSRWDHMYALFRHVLSACIRIPRSHKVVLMVLAPPRAKPLQGRLTASSAGKPVGLQ